MNAVGRFGEWIVRHQLGIEVLLLGLLGFFIVATLAMAIRRERIKKSLLAEIDRKIDDINQQVNGIYGKLVEDSEGHEIEKDEVTLDIDEKQEEPKEQVILRETELQEESAMEAEEEAETKDAEETGVVSTLMMVEDHQEEDDTSISNIISLLRKREPEEETEKIEPVSGNPSVRFCSRDWGVDKHGNVYTEEMLREQIG